MLSQACTTHVHINTTYIIILNCNKKYAGYIYLIQRGFLFYVLINGGEVVHFTAHMWKSVNNLWKSVNNLGESVLSTM